jgi:large subunit ribosomal protein L1
VAEVAKANATYELVIKTAMSCRSINPKGRIALHRETKARSKDHILVFAKGHQADEAKGAGAHIVGGIELADGIISGKHQEDIAANECDPSPDVPPLLTT